MPSTYQTVNIPAPITQIWKNFNDFHDFPWSKNVITSVVKVGDKKGNEIGAKRVLNNAFHETLIDFNADKYILKYSIDDGPSPVSKEDVANYVGIIQLSSLPDEAGTLVEWSSSWSANTDDGVDFCHGIYVALLDELSSSYC
jgi:uncharacterized membrane protein